MSVTFLDANHKLVSVSAANPLPTSGGGGGGAVEVSNFPATQPVSGPLTNAQFIAAIAGAAYTDVTGAATGSIASILKGIFVQLAEINAKTPPLP